MHKLRGVNLGGWFVLEPWIKPSMFEGLDAQDETGFVTVHPDPASALVNHWKTFITKDDLMAARKSGVNTVRLPVPWWMYGDAPYVASASFVKDAVRMCKEAGLDVIIDLHTAPGCQNGFDNGGIKGVIDWHKDPLNITRTIEILERIALDYKDDPAVIGFEVLNEPHMSIDDAIIRDFYLRSYERIRKHTDKLVIFGDAFRASAPFWPSFLSMNGFENIAFDIHPYHCFGEHLPRAPFGTHLDLALNGRLKQIKELSRSVRVIVGEWSLCLKYETMPKDDTFDSGLYDRILGNLQRYVYDHAWGQFFWTLKTEDPKNLHWNYIRLVDSGVLAPFSDEALNFKKNT
jgi:glucan 1,3-beta-glucosidase